MMESFCIEMNKMDRNPVYRSFDVHQAQVCKSVEKCAKVGHKSVKNRQRSWLNRAKNDGFSHHLPSESSET